MEKYTIKELKGAALEKALNDTNEADFDGAADTETLMDYNGLMGCYYDQNGEFIDYGAQY